jgi:replicative DNA helicase
MASILFNAFNEQVVLSTMMHNHGIMKKICRQLSPDDFVGSKHKIIFTGLQRITNSGLEYNEDTLASTVNGEEFGGFKYIRKVYNNYPENPNIDYHIKILKADTIKFKLKKDQIDLLTEVVDDPSTSVEDVLAYITKMQNQIKSQITSSKTLSGKELKKSYIDDLKTRSEMGLFVPTYLAALDELLTEGLARRKVSVIAGRPGMGKTTLMKELAKRQVTNGLKVLLCSIETGSISVLDAMVSDYTSIEVRNIIRNTKELSNKEKKLITEAITKLTNNGLLHFNDETTLTLDNLGNILDANTYTIVYIDLFERLYDIQIKPEKLSEKLKIVQAMAKDTNTHMSLLHQIRRFGQPLDKIKDKRPNMEQLKNSGGYEEVADLVLGLYREKYYDRTVEEDILEIILMKQRRGMSDKIVGFEFDGRYGRIGKGYRNYAPKNNVDEW